MKTDTHTLTVRNKSSGRRVLAIDGTMPELLAIALAVLRSGAGRFVCDLEGKA